MDKWIELCCHEQLYFLIIYAIRVFLIATTDFTGIIFQFT